MSKHTYGHTHTHTHTDCEATAFHLLGPPSTPGPLNRLTVVALKLLMQTHTHTFSVQRESCMKDLLQQVRQGITVRVYMLSQFLLA